MAAFSDMGGLFSTCTFHVNLPSQTSSFRLCSFMDVHWAGDKADHFGHKAWKQFREFDKQTPCPTFYMGNGDYLDFPRSSTKNNLKKTISVDEHKKIDKDNERDLAEFADQIAHLNGKIVGFGDGNHGWVDVHERSDAERLADLFGCAYLGVVAVIRFVITLPGGKATTLYYAQHHGKGGTGKQIGSQFNNLDEMSHIFPEARICVMGDNHGIGCVGANSRMMLRPQKDGTIKMKAHTPLLIRGGSFYRNYNPGQRSYAHDALYSPRALGFTYVTVTPKRVTGKDVGDTLDVDLAATVVTV